MLQRTAPPPRYYRRLARLSSVNQNHGRPRSEVAEPVELRQLQVLADQTLGWASPVWDIKEAVEVGSSPDLEYSDSVSSSSLKTIIELIEDDPHFLAERVNLLASRGDFYSAITLMVTAKMHDEGMPAFGKVSHAGFMNHAAFHKDSKAAVRFLESLPIYHHSGALYNQAMEVCAVSRDLESGIVVREMCEASRHRVSVRLLTTLIKVSKSCGDLKYAVRIFEEIKARKLTLDSHVYGALVSAYAEAMTRNVSVAHERKEQYLLLERAFQHISDAQAGHIALEAPAWNSLVACASRCGELSRAFDVVGQMQAAGVTPDERTYGALIEGCVQAGQAEKALRLFERAIQKVRAVTDSGDTRGRRVCLSTRSRLGRPLAGRRTIVRLTLAPSALSRSLPAPFAQTKGKAHATGGLQHLRPCNRPPHPAGDDLFPRPPPRVQGHKAVEIYTQAISACKIPGCVDWDRALSIFTLMQRNRVRPDKKFYAALMAVAGHAGHLHLAFGLMDEMMAEGIPPQHLHHLARKVYDLCRARDVYPGLSQYNRMMDYYATHFRFGDVVSLLSDMVSAGLTPNLNTYRVVIVACQEAGQVQLAFEVFSLLQQSKIEILQELVKVLGHSPGRQGMSRGGVNGTGVASSVEHTSVDTAGWVARSEGQDPSASRLRAREQRSWVTHDVVSPEGGTDMVRSERAGGTEPAITIPDRGGHAAGQVSSVPQPRVQSPAFSPAPLPPPLPSLNPQKFAQTIYHSLISCCLNQLRLGWGPRGNARGFPPVQYSMSDGSSAGSFSNLFGSMPASRPREAEAVVRSLGKGIVRGSSSSRNSPLSQSVDSINWAAQAVSTYQHMVSKGFTPKLSTLDKLFSCLRMKLLHHPSNNNLRSYRKDGNQRSDVTTSQPGVFRGFAAPAFDPHSVRGVHQSRTHAGARYSSETGSSSTGSSSTGSSSTGSSSARSEEGIKEHDPESSLYEAGFDYRVFTILDQAVARGLLPRITLDKALTVDFTSMPPNVAEVFALAVLLSLERRALRLEHDFHNTSITFVVPPFDPDIVCFPSYVERQHRPLTQDLSPKQLAGILDGSGDSLELEEDAPSDRISGSFASLSSLLDAGDAVRSEGEESGSDADAASQSSSPQEEEGDDSSGSSTTAEHSDPGQEGPAAGGYAHDPLYGEPYAGYSPSVATQAEVEDKAAEAEAARMFGTLYSRAAHGQPHLDEEDDGAGHVGSADQRTGLAVAAVLRKMRVFGLQMNWRQGTILLSPKVIFTWLSSKRKRSTEGQMHSPAAPTPEARVRLPSSQLPGAHMFNPIADQASRIRSGFYGEQPARGGSYDELELPPRSRPYDEPPARGGSYDEPPVRGGSYDEPPVRGGSYDEDRLTRPSLFSPPAAAVNIPSLSLPEPQASSHPTLSGLHPPPQTPTATEQPSRNGHSGATSSAVGQAASNGAPPTQVHPAAAHGLPSSESNGHGAHADRGGSSSSSHTETAVRPSHSPTGAGQGEAPSSLDDVPATVGAYRWKADATSH
ncbi:MAG: hypothetical protein WDW38_005383 [Sanguina aurantia]